MEILKNAHLCHVQAGRLTLQMPEWDIVPGKNPGAMIAQGVVNNGVSYPDDYFMYTKIVGYNNQVGCRQRVAVGREQGYLTLTRTGFNYFKNDLKANWSTQRGSTWQEFEYYADQFLNIVKDETQKHLLRMQTELQIKNTPYNQKRVQECQDALRNL